MSNQRQPDQYRQPLFDLPTDEADQGVLRLGIAGDGDLRWAVADISRPLEAMRSRLDLSPTAAVALGRALAASSLLLRFSTKYPGRLRLEIDGDGPLGRLYAETDSEGRLRGLVGEPQFPGFDEGRLEIGRAVGDGMMRVTQEFAGRREPWVSQTKLVDGEIGNDLVHFLLQSQQIRSAALLSVKPGPAGILAAGGLLVEAFPEADDDAVSRLEKNIAALPAIGELLDGGGSEALLDAALDGLGREELESYALSYACDCSRESLLDRLRTLPESDLADIGDDEGKAILECAYCQGEIVFSVAELLN